MRCGRQWNATYGSYGGSRTLPPCADAAGLEGFQFGEEHGDVGAVVFQAPFEVVPQDPVTAVIAPMR